MFNLLKAYLLNFSFLICTVSVLDFPLHFFKNSFHVSEILHLFSCYVHFFL